MRAWHLLVIVGMASCMAACVPASPSAGLLQAFAQVCDQANQGLRVAVEGYLRLPDTLTDTGSVRLRLYRDSTYGGKPIGVSMRFGDGPNQASAIKSSFVDSDLKVHLANGKPVPFGTRLRVSGTVRFPIPPQDFDCELDDLYVELAK